MTEIYGKAQNVLIWLGRPAHGSELLMEAILQGNISDQHSAETVALFSAMANMRHRNWFKRMWTLQEFAIPDGTPLLFCGAGPPVCWDCFDAADSNVSAAHAALRQKVSQVMTEVLNEGLSSWNTDDPRLAILSSVEGSEQLLSWVNQGEKDPSSSLSTLRTSFNDKDVSMKGRKTLSKVLVLSRRAQSRDPRDRVYGVLGLVDSALRQQFVSECGISYDARTKASDVFADAVKWMLRVEDSQVIRIYDNFPLNKDTSLPSWVPSFDEGQQSEREYASASWSANKAPRLDPPPSFSNGRLLSKAIVIDVIDQVIDFGSETDFVDWTGTSILLGIFFDWLNELGRRQGTSFAAQPRGMSRITMRKAYYMDKVVAALEQIRRLLKIKEPTRLSEALWPILLGDSWGDGQLQEYQDLEATLKALSGMRFGWEKFKQKLELIPRSSYIKFTKAVQTAYLFVGENGNYGVTPGKVKRGDKLMLLFPNQHVPFVVRSYGKDIRLLGVAEIPAAVRDEALQRGRNHLHDVTIA